MPRHRQPTRPNTKPRCRGLASIGLFLLLSLCSCNQSAQAALIDSHGQTVDIAAWQNKWVIINYWATWCEPCAKEIPQLNLFYQHHQQQIVMWGVNLENLNAADLSAAIKFMHIRFPVLQTNPAKILGLPPIQVIPTTFIINPQGKIVKQLFGPQSAAGLEEIINARD